LKQPYFSLKPYYFYLAICICYFIIAAAILLLSQKGQSELYINSHFTPYFDTFFKYYTNLGDGWFYAAFNIALLLVGFYEVLLALVTILITTSIIHLCKEILFHGISRPMGFFVRDLNIHLVNGVDIHLENTFPSGHTCTGFNMAIMLVFILVKYQPAFKNIWVSFIFILAFLIGISRIYLMQHFLADTMAGTFVGTFVALLVIVLFEKYTPLKDHTFWKRSLLRLKN